MDIKEFTTMKVKRKDVEFLLKIKKNTNKSSAWAVLESMIKVIKEHKMEEEIK